MAGRPSSSSRPAAAAAAPAAASSKTTTGRIIDSVAKGSAAAAAAAPPPGGDKKPQQQQQPSSSLVAFAPPPPRHAPAPPPPPSSSSDSSSLARRMPAKWPRPKWHPHWRCYRVVAGHLGWVRSLAVDPVSNEWFASGSADRTIKIWVREILFMLFSFFSPFFFLHPHRRRRGEREKKTQFFPLLS